MVRIYFKQGKWHSCKTRRVVARSTVTREFQRRANLGWSRRERGYVNEVRHVFYLKDTRTGKKLDDTVFEVIINCKTITPGKCDNIDFLDETARKFWKQIHAGWFKYPRNPLVDTTVISKRRINDLVYRVPVTSCHEPVIEMNAFRTHYKTEGRAQAESEYYLKSQVEGKRVKVVEVRGNIDKSYSKGDMI